MNIAPMIDALIDREGGYTNNPNDRGGPTKFGVTEVEARANGYKGDMRAFPRDLAVSIYTAKYWTRPGFDKVALRSEKLASELFDTGVNMGPKKAAEFLQRALNILNNGGKLYHDIIADGDLGPMSLYALDGLIAARGARNAELVLLRLVDGLQLARYVDIGEANPTQEAFEWGWILNRIGVKGD